MTPLSWDVDPRGWDAATCGHGQTMVDRIVSMIKRTTRPGSIILSHGRVRPGTIATYKILLPWLKDHFPDHAVWCSEVWSYQRRMRMPYGVSGS